ncbi:hypothetical protein [Oceanobacter mangrovi]|uniref:hypothetical protein n=1 Tax=Oceanobacter mangrovi TaxID=2862510 RepID=UPI001C8ED3A1|nr:hypothetical protein [Oceanobacter mangrovi]
MDPFAKAVPNRPKTVRETEAEVVNTLDKAERHAKIDHRQALTGDVRANTNLKIGLSAFLCVLISGWFIGLFWLIGDYFRQMATLGIEIPSSVMLALIGAGSGVIGLMGYILKGVFKSN